MDDLIGLIFFIVIAAINLLAQANKKKKAKERAENPDSVSERKPTPFEAFFEDLAMKLEPQPTEMPDWPDSIERPDYVEEMEEFEEEQEAEPAPVMAYSTMPDPVIPDLPLRPETKAIAEFKAPAMVSSSVFSGSNLMRFQSIPLMSNNANGHIDLDLKDRRNLKKAILAGLVFGQPRACDCSFDNTIAK